MYLLHFLTLNLDGFLTGPHRDWLHTLRLCRFVFGCVASTRRSKRQPNDASKLGDSLHIRLRLDARSRNWRVQQRWH